LRRAVQLCDEQQGLHHASDVGGKEILQFKFWLFFFNFLTYQDSISYSCSETAIKIIMAVDVLQSSFLRFLGIKVKRFRFIVNPVKVVAVNFCNEMKIVDFKR